LKILSTNLLIYIKIKMNTNNEANNNGSQAISLDLANIKAYEWFSKINTNAVTDSEKEYVNKLLTTIALNGAQDSVTFADSRLVYIATKMLINHSMSETLLPEYGVSEYSIYLSYVKTFYDADNVARNEIIEFVTLWLSYLVNEYVMDSEELGKLSSLANSILEYVNTMEVVYKKVPDFVIVTLLDVSKWEVGEPVMPIDSADIENADLEEREPEVAEVSDETERQIKELQDDIETFQFLIDSGATEEQVRDLQDAIETFEFLLLSLQLQKLGLTEMEQDAMQALILNLTEEPSYTSVNVEDLSGATGIDTKKMRGVLASLVKKGIIYIDKGGSELELINLNKDFWYLHPQWKNEVDNYPQIRGKYAKGGKLTNKATYIPKRDIAEIEVEANGKTRFVDGANLLDGVYVKKGKYARGGLTLFSVIDFVKAGLVEDYDYTEDEAEETVDRLHWHIEKMYESGDSANEIANDLVRLNDERKEQFRKKNNDYVVYAQGGSLNEERYVQLANEIVDVYERVYRIDREKAHKFVFNANRLDDIKTLLQDHPPHQVADLYLDDLIGKYYQSPPGEREYAKGGTATRYFDVVKKTVDKGYNKSKEYTKKKIHDFNKKIALDVLDQTKDKVENLKKLDLKAAEKIVEKSYAKGGRAGQYNSLMELYNLRDAGYRTVSLNGFEESIGYVIDLKLDDKDLKKVGERSYITTYEKGGDVKKKTWTAIFQKGNERKIVQVEAGTEQEARMEAEKARNEYGLSKELFLYDLFYAKGGEVRKLKQSDAVLYKKEVWYVTEKNGVMGITNFSPGAWGFNYPFIPLTKVNLSEATDFYGNKVEYAKGGQANSIKYNFKLVTPGEFEDSLKDEKKKIDILRKFIDFDEVTGNIDYEKLQDNTVLNFLLNKKRVMSLVGHFNEDSGQLETVIEADGNIAELNYHPFDGMGGLNFNKLEQSIKQAFESMNMYNAVVSVEGYEEYAENVEGLENAKSRIKDIKGNTKFQVVKGENVGVGKRVDSSNVIAEYAEGGVVKKVKTLNDIQNDPRVSDIYKDNSTGEPGYWMSLKEGYVSAWDRGNSVRSENLSYLKDMLNTPGGIITKQEFDTTFAEDEYTNGGKMQDYYDGQGDEGEGETFDELRGQIIQGIIEDLRVSRSIAEKIVEENKSTLIDLIENEGETNIYTLVMKIQGNEDDYAKGGRSKSSSYTIKDDVGDVVVENADEEAVILFANTMFYYDTMDSGEEQIETFSEAVSGLKSMDYSVQKVKMAEGGKIGFDALANKVSDSYEGKKVPAKYQKQYGKRYSKSEANEVGNKVAAKVYRQQLKNK